MEYYAEFSRFQVKEFQKHTLSIFRTVPEPPGLEYVASWAYWLNHSGVLIQSSLEVYLKSEQLTLNQSAEIFMAHREIGHSIKLKIAVVLEAPCLVQSEPFHGINYYRFPVAEWERAMLAEMENTQYGRTFLENVFMYNVQEQAFRAYAKQAHPAPHPPALK